MGLGDTQPLALKGRFYDHGVMAPSSSALPADTSTLPSHGAQPSSSALPADIPSPHTDPTPPAGRNITSRDRASELAPGLAVAALFGLLARELSGLVSVSSLTIAVIAGILLGNSGLSARQTSTDLLLPGLAFAGRSVLRLGVIAMGLRLSVGQIGALGTATILVIIATVTATFFGTQALGRRLGVSEPLSLLVATGYSICGASAIAAMESSSDADEDEVALSIGLVTLAGTIAMFAVPAIGDLLSLSDHHYAVWAGASIHDVAQVVAAGSSRGSAVLATAVVVKLTRVMLLAPLVTGVSLARHRRETRTNEPRPAPIPLFVAGFLFLVAIRSTGIVPMTVIEGVADVEKLLFATALVGLGSGVRLDRMRTLGGAPLLLGALASIIVGAVSLAAVLLTG